MNAPAVIERRGFIGGSDIAAIIGHSPWKDPFGLYLEKRGELDPDPDESKAMRRGKILESAIAQMYREEHDADVTFPQRNAYITGPEPWMRAQVDAWEAVPTISAGEQERQTMIPLEIKSASEYTRGKWGPTGTDDAPVYYCTQLHWQMQLSGAPFGRIVALLGSDDLRVYTIQRDAQIDRFLMQAARDFWRRIETADPPPVLYEHANTGATLDRLFASPNATTIAQAPDGLRHWLHVYQDAAKHAADYERTRATAKAHMLHFMGNAGVLDFGDVQYQRVIRQRAAYTCEATSYIEFRKKAKSRTRGAAAITDESED